MWAHFFNLLGHSWAAFIESLGSTTLGFIAPFLVPIAGFCIYGLLILHREGWRGVKEHFREKLTVAVFFAIAAELIIYVPIFSWSVVKTVYQDHMSLVAAANRNPISSQPAPTNSNYGIVVNGSNSGNLSNNVNQFQKPEVDLVQDLGTTKEPDGTYIEKALVKVIYDKIVPPEMIVTARAESILSLEFRALDQNPQIDGPENKERTGYITKMTRNPLGRYIISVRTKKAELSYLSFAFP